VKSVSCIECHVAGQPLRLVTGGLPPIRGKTMVERLLFARRRLEGLRRALILEPRGHRDMTGAVLTEATTAGADAGVMFLDADGWRGLCGHGLIGTTAIAVERGLLMTGRNDGLVTLETVAGLVTTRLAREAHPPSTAGDASSRGRRVTFTAPPAQVVAAGVHLQLPNRRVLADLARCNGLFAIVDAERVGVGLSAANWPRLRELAVEILEALPPADLVEGVVFTGPPHGDAHLRAVTVYDGGCLDRSPSGLGLAALAAVLRDMGLATDGQDLRIEGAADLTMTARIGAEADVDGKPALQVDITGSAWMTGEHTFLIEDGDPLAEGWPR
jgi:proline racemase